MTLAYNDETWEPLASRIVAQGADLEVRKAWGETALMTAAGAKNTWLVTLLLQAGADVNACSTHGSTPLMNAVTSRFAPVAIVEPLLVAGTAVNARDKKGWSAPTRKSSA